MNIETIVVTSTSLPVFGLLYSILFPLAFDYEVVTSTHCHAQNFLPSLSAAISYSPQTAVIWFLCILFHTPFRFILARRLNDTYKRLFAKYYTSEFLSRSSNQEYKEFLKIRRFLFFAYTVNKAEIIGLLVLSIFTSKSNFELHKFGFILYLASSALFTILVCKIEYKLQSVNLLNLFLIRSKLAIVYATCFAISILFYMIHNYYCPNYVYSFFGLAEIIMILSNVAFHAWSYFLIKDLPVEISQV